MNNFYIEAIAKLSPHLVRMSEEEHTDKLSIDIQILKLNSDDPTPFFF